MSEWKARRFWTSAKVRPAGDGWEVVLDDRPLRTPGKHPLILPTQALAEAVAAEWDAQADVIDPNRMPLTRAANSAIEKVTPQFDEVAAMLAEYGGTDLLSYRAQEPEALVRAQAEGWDPLIDWSATELRAPLRITHGVIPVPQDPATLLKLQAEVAALDAFGLTALHDLVTLPGSLILGLAVVRGRIDAATAHALARIDEEFQAGRWGRDEEADAAAAARLAAMRDSERFWHLSRR
ncbi:Chaperone required for the assembly of the F1-ATPase [Paracoccus aminovorans]|uniref:Chaperone required for the assembly of the F1-ATPase n=1 Tax=Paracoccus aminovorans TaxID=34004 RepID=A0A1I2XTX1_9RHOB|nr:ATP12 family protein [Paracoccus aminovorans]CQR87234.1 ATP12 chaperone protein [Paracoccus aminovorans]SFH16910.1 Chaperone required for the assembly of the F1-ATPase [Paracoccus aminovorans]